MIINAVRYRFEGHDEWTTFRLSAGTGHFRGLAVVTAAGEESRIFAEAIAFVLTGQGVPSSLPRPVGQALEVSLQVSDDAGDTWVIHRKGEQVRYLRNGETQSDASGATAALAFTNAFMDLDAVADDGSVAIAVTEVASDKQGLFGKPYGQETTTRDQLREVLGRQIADLSGDAAKALSCRALGTPKMLAKLARNLEPLHQEYRELTRQWHELGLGGMAAASMQADETNEASLAKIKDEIELGREIAKVAGPLLEPGVSTKSMEDTLAKIDAAIVDLCGVCGLERLPAPGDSRDFRKALEAVSRLEAFAKLIRATQAVRKHCDQRIEPVFKNYLMAVEGALANDKQIASELESCLATLDLKLRVKPQTAADLQARKNWFERFKAQKPETEGARDEQTHDLETARMAIDYALTRLTQLGGDVEDAKKQQESALHAVDTALEELVKNYGRLKAHWVALAKQMSLAEDMSMTQLLKIIGYHGKLVQLAEQRDEIKEQIKQFKSRHTTLERLITKWRETTGSQKLTSLKNPGILLTEARDVLRYLEVKQRKMEQLSTDHEANKAMASLRGFMKGRQQKLEAAWQKVFVDLELAPLQADHPYLPELFKRANLVKALALAHGTVSKDARQPLFTETGKTVVNIMIWNDAKPENQLKLELVKGLEQNPMVGLTVLIAADPQVAQLLQGLGAGIAQLAKRQSVAKPAERPVVLPPSSTANPAVQKGASTATVGGEVRRPSNATLMEQRARAALDILTGQTKGSGRRI